MSRRGMCQVLCTILIARKTSGLWLTQVCPGTGNTVRQGNYHVRHQTGAWSWRPTRNSWWWCIYVSGGWWLRDTYGMKNYLTEVFQGGERTGQKADPTSVLKAMRIVKHSDGSNIFDKCLRHHYKYCSRIFFLACQQGKCIVWNNPVRRKNLKGMSW